MNADLSDDCCLTTIHLVREVVSPVMIMMIGICHIIFRIGGDNVLFYRHSFLQ